MKKWEQEFSPEDTVAGWRDRARAKRWPEHELDIVESMLPFERIDAISVDSYRIIRYRVQREFDIIHRIVVPTIRKWEYFPEVEPQFAKDDPSKPWCPAHSHECMPTTDRECGWKNSASAYVSVAPTHTVGSALVSRKKHNHVDGAQQQLCVDHAR